jgi:general secretion pathway protein K
MRTGRNGKHEERGVALLIALLVMTLLMALVMEFAYGTRVSLRAAANFRDARRAEHLALSGVNVAGKILAELLRNNRPQDNLEQREWQVVPVMSGDDTELRVRWEDEAGKINIASLGAGQQSLVRLERLFGERAIPLDVLDRLKERRTLRLLDELHQVLSDEEFGKLWDRREAGIVPLVTVSGSDAVNVNTAPAPVLQSLGLSAAQASLIIEGRSRGPYTDKTGIPGYEGINPSVQGYLVVSSNIFTVHAHATVGGYTKQAEAVVTRNAGGFTVLSMKVL